MNMRIKETSRDPTGSKIVRFPSADNISDTSGARDSDEQNLLLQIVAEGAETILREKQTLDLIRDRLTKARKYYSELRKRPGGEAPLLTVYELRKLDIIERDYDELYWFYNGRQRRGYLTNILLHRLRVAIFEMEIECGRHSDQVQEATTSVSKAWLKYLEGCTKDLRIIQEIYTLRKEMQNGPHNTN